MAFTYTTVDGQRVERNVAAAFRRMAADFRKKFGLTLHVRSGTRTRAEQMALHQRHLKGGTLALHPDSPLAYHVESNPRGPRALDIYDSGTDAGVTRDGNKRSAWVRKNARKYGFDPAGYRFSQKEPWHIEFTDALYSGAPASVEKEDDMPLSDEDITKVARAVHNYRSSVNKLKFGDMLRHVYDSVRFGEANVRTHGSLTGAIMSEIGAQKIYRATHGQSQKIDVSALADAIAEQLDPIDAEDLARTILRAQGKALGGI